MTNTNPISLMCVFDVRFVKTDCVMVHDLVAVMEPLLDEAMLCCPLARRGALVVSRVHVFDAASNHQPYQKKKCAVIIFI